MIAAVPLALLMFAQVAAGATGDADPRADSPKAASEDDCAAPGADTRVIVICAQRPQGYRLDPDVMRAKREMKSAGRPVRPGATPPQPCGTVGPQPCQYGGVDLIGVALTAAEMAKRIAEGKEVGSMFKTDPHPSEYQLYLMAKAQREAEEAEKRAARRAKAAAAVRAAQKQPETPTAAQSEPPPNER